MSPRCRCADADHGRAARRRRAVWIGQGLGLLRGSSFMADDLRWAVGRRWCSVGRRHGARGQRWRARRRGLSQAAHVASAGPAVTSLPWRTSGNRSRRVSASEPLDDLGVAHREVAETARRGTAFDVVVEQGARARAARRTGAARRRDRPLPQVDVVDRRSGAPGRSAAPRAWPASRPGRRPGCRASSASASLPSGAGIGP